MTKLSLMLTVLLLTGALSAQAQEETPSPCRPTTSFVSMTYNSDGPGRTGDGPDQSLTLTVTNLCDGVRLHVEIAAESDSLDFSCELLTLRQPRDLSQLEEAPAWLPDEHDDTEDYLYYYGGHGYHHDEPSRFNHYVTVHQPGNTAGICHPVPIRKGQPRRFWISIEPERVDNPEPLSFLQPFSLYYGAYRMLAFP